MAKMKNTGVVLLGAATILLAATLLWRSPESPSSETKEAVPQNNNFAQAPRLEGKWVRTDGGYTFVIEDVRPDGSLKASYYNPRKINVHEAHWEVGEDSVYLFVELRDTNYPGSKYSLVHTKEDVLEGAYFQAVARETYSVKFLKIPETQN